MDSTLEKNNRVPNGKRKSIVMYNSVAQQRDATRQLPALIKTLTMCPCHAKRHFLFWPKNKKKKKNLGCIKKDRLGGLP